LPLRPSAAPGWPGRWAGDVQIASRVVEGKIDGVIFLIGSPLLTTLRAAS
jgi:methylglyoxal synthase